MREVLIQEMSELFDKEVNAQKESLKNFWGSCKLPQAHGKVCDENKRNKHKKQDKNDTHVKMLLMEGSTCRALTKNRRKRFGQASGQ